jgi:hypothetical protein
MKNLIERVALVQGKGQHQSARIVQKEMIKVLLKLSHYGADY